MRWLDKLKKGLQKTARVFSFKSLNLDDLEESLLMADIGVKLTDEVLKKVRDENPKDTDEMRQIIRQIFIEKIQPVVRPLTLPDCHPAVVLMIGVNGAGKTTLIKLMMRLYDPTEGEILYNGVNIKCLHHYILYRSDGVLQRENVI